MKITSCLLLTVVIVFAIFAVPVSANPGNPHFSTIRYQLGTGTLQYNFNIDINNHPENPEGIPVGTVTVWADNDQSPVKLFIKMTLFSENEYTLYESHLAVATRPWINTSGNTIPDEPGQMTKIHATGYYGNSHNHPAPYLKNYIYEIPLSLLGVTPPLQGSDSGDMLVICVHASLARGVETGVDTIYATGIGEFVGIVPELPAGVLVGIGLAGIITFIAIKRKKILVH
jgi:hypothetical protein